MSPALAGDPGSVSHTAGALRRLGIRLRAAGDRLDATGPPSGSSVAGRPARDLARRQVRLATAARVAAAEADTAGTLLQDHATDLAEALHAVRAVQERAAATGLEVTEGRVRLAWGVSGIADPSSAAAREQERAALQAELDHVMLQCARRRQRLVAAVTSAAEALAEQSRSLRA